MGLGSYVSSSSKDFAQEGQSRWVIWGGKGPFGHPRLLPGAG